MIDNISKLESQADYIANNLTEWEAESIARIARRCGKIGKMSKEEAEKFDTEKEAKKEWEKIVAALAIATALNIRSLKKAYTAEFEDWHTANKYLYDYRGIDFVEIAKNKQMQGIIDNFVKQNGKDILNLTNTKALRVLDRNGTPIRFQDEIYKAFGEAVGYVKEGRTDFYSAMRQTIQNLGGGGCKIDYGGGITRRLDTVVRQNMMYGMKQAHKEYNAIVGQELGCDGIEIDYHSNSRPSHRYMQGKQYAKGAEGKTVNGVFYPSAEKEGVYARLYEDYNCYHYETDIILGVSEPRYSAEELRRFDEQDKRIYKIGDIEKDGYGWSQTMRGLEADMRKSKDEINALSALGGNEAKIKELKNRIKTFQGKYDEISDITGIAKEKRRLTVQKPQNVLTNNTSGSIINTGNEVFRTKSNKNLSNRIALSQKRFDELTIEAKKNGAKIIKCEYDDEIFKHLEKSGATASCIGDTLLFRPDATISEVLEETHHFMQNINGLNDDKSAVLRTILNEIEAKEFIINNAKKYNVPRAEIEETMKHLESYKKQLKEYYKGE